jgi:hypothetical protein
MEKTKLKIFLDTNIVIYFLKGFPEVVELLSQAEDIAISFITYIELLCYELDKREQRNIIEFVKYIEIKYPDEITANLTIDIRRKTKLKIPDAIICAQAKQSNFLLVTADKEILKKMDKDSIIDPFSVK